MGEGGGGRMEVGLDGDNQAVPVTAKLGGKQLTIGQMMEDRNSQDAGGTGQKKMLSSETLELLAKRAEVINQQAAAGEQPAQPAGPNPADQPQQQPQPQPQAQPQAQAPPVVAPVDQDPKLEPAPTTEESLLISGTNTNPYDDPKLKEAIEKRLTDLSFDSLLTNREIRQTVNIRPGELEVEFRSHTEGEEKYVRAVLFAEGREGTSADMFYTRQADYLLALNLAAINGIQLKGHMTDGRIDEAKFKAKLAVIESYPAQLLGLLAINNTWFEERLRKLVTEGNIKNG